MAGQGSQVGSAHISIFPVMSGFRSAVNKEARSSGDSAGSIISKAFDNAGQVSGRKLGQQLKASLSQSAGDLADSALSVFNKDVASATDALAKARRKQANDADAVKVSEMRLKDAIKKYGEESTEAMAATARLNAAKRRLEASDATLKASNDRLAAAEDMLKRATEELDKAMGEAASSSDGMAKRFAAGFRSVEAAASSSTGIAGALGGLARSISGIDLLAPLASRVAAGGRKLASSTASAVQGALAKARSAASAGASAVSTALGTGLARAQSAASSAMERAAANIPAPIKSMASKFGTYLSPVVSSAKAVFDKLPAAASSGLSSLVSSVRGSASKLGDAFKGAAGAIGSAALGGLATAAATATGAIAALVPSALSASDATDKFKSTLDFAGLDTSAIDALVSSTRAYADATVYELADIQGITAQLASNGVKDFDRLAEAAGNLNAVAGGNVDTYKSVGTVLTQTAGLGKLTTENWNQLSEAIPGASGRLQEAMRKNGAYTGNFRDAMEQGQITADEFNQAIMDLGFEDAAVEAAKSTKTFEGAWGQFKAAITSGLTDALAPIKPLITSALSGAAEWIEPLFDGLASGTEAFADFVGGIQSNAGKLSGAFSGVSALVGPVAGLVTALGAGGMSGALGALANVAGPVGKVLAALAGPLKMLTGPVGIISSLLIGMIATTPALQQQIAGIVEQVGGGLMGVINAILPPVQQIVTSILPVVNQMVAALVPVVSAILELVGGTAMAILAAITPGIQMIATAISQLVAIAMPLIQQFADMFIALMPQVSALISSLTPIIMMLGSIVGQVVSSIVAFITGTLVPAFQAMSPAISAVVSMVGGVIQGLVQVVSGVVSMISGVISGDWSQVWEGFKSIVSGAITSIGEFLGGVKDIVLNAFSGVGEWLVDSGKALIDGFVSGITGAIDWAGQQISSGLETLRGFFPFSPAKRGPFSGHGYTTYSGAAMMGDFADAAYRRALEARTQVRHALEAIRAEFYPGDDAGARGGAGVAGNGGQRRPLQQTFIFNQPVETPDEFARAMRLRERYGLAAVQ